MTNHDECNGFTFFRSYFEAARELPNDQRLALYDAIIEYGIDGTENDLSGVIKSLFILVKPTLNKSKAKAIAGAKGGKANGKQSESIPEANEKQIESHKDKDKCPATR